MSFGNTLPAEWLGLAGLFAAALSTLAYLPYIRDILRGQTRPHRATWLIWMVLSGISTASQFHEGATDSLWFSLVQSTGTAVIFVLSIFFGMGRYFGAKDGLILTAAACGLGLWYLSDSAAYALTIAISISALGGVATVIKSYRAPETETLSCWYLNLVAAALALLVVGQPSWVLIAYPMYLVVLYAAIISAISLGRIGRTLKGRIVAAE